MDNWRSYEIYDSGLDKRLSRLDWIQSNLRQKILEIEIFFNAQNSSYIYY